MFAKRQPAFAGASAASAAREKPSVKSVLGFLKQPMVAAGGAGVMFVAAAAPW